jgi:hypothetical protein
MKTLVRIFLRTITICFLTTVVFAAFGKYFNSIDEDLHTDCLYPTILICDEYGGHGSGVIIRSDKVGDKYLNVALTCAHVVSKPSDLRAYITNYKDWSAVDYRCSYPSFVYHWNSEDDIAVIFFLSECKPYVANIDLRDTVYTGNEIVGVGCSALDYPRLDKGYINGIGSDYRASITTVPGDSGGPVYYQNRLIGIKKAVRSMGDYIVPGITFVSPTYRIKGWGDEFAFLYKKSAPLPTLPVMVLNAQKIQSPTRSPFDGKFP